MEKYLEDIKQSKTREEIKKILETLFNDNTINDIDFDYLIGQIIPIIENNLQIKIDNFENTDTSSYQKVLEFDF